MRTGMLRLALAGVLAGQFAVAGEAPRFFQNTYPEHAIDQAMAWSDALKGENAVTDEKTRQLISIAVAAQIPCSYCVYAHTRMARANGATDAEVREAVAIAAYVRHWSTVLNGMGYDLETFKLEVDEMVPAN